MLRIKKLISGSIKSRLYLLSVLVVLIMLIMVLVLVWAGNTLTVITSIARFERTHTVSRVEAINFFHQYYDHKNPADLQSFREKWAITQSYNKVFGSLLEMRKTLSKNEFVDVVDKTFVEADRNTSEKLVNRIHILYWHPLLIEMVEHAKSAHHLGIRIDELVKVLLASDSVEKKKSAFDEIDRIEKQFKSLEIDFSNKSGKLGTEIAHIINLLSVGLLLISIGTTGLLAFLTIRSITVPIERFILYSKQIAGGNLDTEIPEISGDELLALNDSMSLLLSLNKKLKNEVDEKNQTTLKLFNANRQIARSELKQKTMISNISDVIGIMDADGIITFKSPSIEKWFGWEPEDLVGTFGWSTVHPDDLAHVQNMFFSLLEGALSTKTIEFRYKCKDGRFKPVELSAVDLTNDPVINGILLNYHDITWRKKSEEALKQSNAYLYSIIESPKDIDIFALDLDGNYTVFNNNHKMVMKMLYGTDVETGANIFDLITNTSDRGQAVTLFKKAAGGEHFTVIQEYGSVGVRRPFEISCHPIIDKANGEITGVTLFKVDITERVKLEFMLLQSQKMEAIGTLAGGIAHDFNNILGGIVGYIQLAELEIPHDQKAYRYIDQVLKASYRARDLVQQILTFSRQTEVEKKPLLVGLIVKEVVKLLKASLPSSIEVELTIKNPEIMITANSTQIHQVLMNLCTNAKHAIGSNIGRLTIIVESMAVIEKGAFSTFNLAGDNYVLIKITDTGMGIPPNILSRIFEPYFTTKEKGEGTGLGLAVVHKIITDHKGGIDIESRQGEGTTFTIALPIHEGSPEEIHFKAKELPGGKERIMLVDDEIFLLEMGQEILERLGYDVTSTSSPEEAVQIIRKAPENFDLLITDMTMPKLTGEMLATKIHEFKPDLPVILCTGFSESMNAERAEKAGINAILLKPVLIEKFSSALRNVLDKKHDEIDLGKAHKGAPHSHD